MSGPVAAGSILDLPPEIEAARASLARFVSREIEPAIDGFEAAGEFPRSLIRKMGEAGFFGAAFPTALGGSALGLRAVAVIAEELSRLRPEFGYCMNLQAMTCPFTILNWGTAAQIARFVPALIRAEKIGMFALTEPGGGSDAAGAMRTRAVRSGDSYILNGEKTFITFAHAADAGVLFALTDPAAGHRGITAFIVEPRSAPGYSAEPIPMRGLSRALASCSVHLNDFSLPVENRLGAEGEGFRIAMHALGYGRLTVAARLTGLAQALLDASIAYARTREVRGRPLGQYQMVQSLIADMATETDAARLMTGHAATLAESGRPFHRAVARAKYFASETARRAALAATELHGGYALTEAYRVGYFAAYVTMLTAGEGTANVQRILIAEDALGYKDADRHPIPPRFPVVDAA
ncbi:MAG: acyl-CoA dehydrogenase family protein [Acetobacteraceae bacterium]